MKRPHIARLSLAILLLSLFCLFDCSNAFAIPGYTLTVNVTGSGVVYRSQTNATYPPGATITLTAVSNNPTWYFSAWSGDATGSANPKNVTMDSNVVVTATFLQLSTFTLSLATNGQGSITLSPTGGVYVSNTVVNVTATPSAGWLFLDWTGAANNQANPVAVTMTTNKALTGTFVQMPGFDVQPQNSTNAIGSTATFTPHSVGTGLSYQWYFSGSPLAGKTSSSLSITNVQLASAGNYQVIAMNAYGSATSSVAALIITNGTPSTNTLLTCDEGSLRAAIQKGGWVGIACNGAITLTNTITITNNVILDAKNVSLTISGNNPFRLFSISSGATLSATNVVFANGCISNSVTANGGAIYNDAGTVTLVSCVLSNNIANSPTQALGGAVYSQNGSVFLFNTCFFNNVAGGIDGTFTTWHASGGAIFFTNSTVKIINCAFANNLCRTNHFTSGGASAGGAVFQASGSLFITNSLFTANMALGGHELSISIIDGPGYGGALYCAAGTAAVDHSSFIANVAKGSDRQKFPTEGSGGAIYNNAANLTVQNGLFCGNQALSGDFSANSFERNGRGGAIYNAGTAVLNQCALFSNNAHGSRGTLINTQPQAGGSGFGGGIFNASQLAATNCTIALNSAIAGAGYGIFGSFSTNQAPNGCGIGGGIFGSNGSTTILMNCTVVTNFCSASGPDFTGSGGLAAGAQVANSNGVVRLHNTIIAYSGTNSNAYGPVTDDGYNISSDSSAGFSSGSSYNFTDPRLDPANGLGLTWSMPPRSNSAAIDFGDSAGAPATDQRGYARPNGSGFDIGAVEYYPFSTPQVDHVSTRTNLTLSFTAYPPTIYRVQFSTNMVSWTDLETNGPFGAVTNLSRTLTIQPANRFFRIFCQ